MAKATTRRTKSMPAGAESPSAAARFPIVGIGASAGGLGALEDFFRHVQRQTDAAFVIVQHMTAGSVPTLVALVQRVTRIRVRGATDKLRVRSGHVYVAPGHQNVSIEKGLLRLRPQAQSPSIFGLPVDVFFRSLAADQREWSVGVVLSGMGADGSRGLFAIKANGGTACAQGLSSAKHESMPRSALELAVVDIVAPAEELAERIQARFPRARRAEQLETSSVEAGAQLPDCSTQFFRDPEAWEHLRTMVIPALLRRHGDRQPLRAWVAGCSTGEEAYSLAIVLREALDELNPSMDLSVRILATDVDPGAIEQARRGDYPRSIDEHVSAPRLERFFEPPSGGGGRFHVRQEIRDMIVFGPHDLRSDPPFSRLDVLSCRNVLCHLGADCTVPLIPLFRRSLLPGGALFLGRGESVEPFGTLFASLNERHCTWRR